LEPIIVETDWLAERLDDPNIVVIDVRQPYFFGQGHIPGAVNLPDYYLAAPSGGAPPPADDLARRLGLLGVTRDTHIVACDDGGSYSAARLFWVLRYYRHPNISVLDGGVTRWRHEGRDWEYAETPATETQYEIGSPDAAVTTDFNAVLSSIGAPDTVVLDVRSPAEYLGHQPTAARNGRIPGAVNIDWANNLERVNGTYYHFRPSDQLRTLYETAGATTDKRIVVYCQAGGRATAAFLALQALGYPEVQVYPEGWQEWGNRRDAPVEEG
jgi:thiosulfate/3-mercaptopyruvate sulfurtransferase